MATTQKPRGILKIKRKNTNSVQGRAKSFSNGLLSNTTEFSSLATQANAIAAQSTVLDKAETVAKEKAPGAAAARNVQRDALIGLMVSTLAQVQTIADAATSYDQAVSILQAAGVLVAIVPSRSKAILTVKQGPQGGSVALDANATALGASKSKSVESLGNPRENDHGDPREDDHPRPRRCDRGARGKLTVGAAGI